MARYPNRAREPCDANSAAGRPAPNTRRFVVALVSASSLALVACGQPITAPASGTTASALRAYLASVEPIRLIVNELLQNADPVIEAYREHDLTGAQAAAEMGSLEQTFAAYTVDINAVHPTDPTLAAINGPYAHTFILEDSYLNALVTGLAEDDVSDLPDTQNDQRIAIIEWSVQLEILARKLGIVLPTDLQQAGRGEIAPSVSGTS